MISHKESDNPFDALLSNPQERSESLIEALTGGKQNQSSQNVQDEQNHQQSDSKEKDKKAENKNARVDDREFGERDDMYMIRKHKENVANDGIIFSEYEARTVGDFTFHIKKDFTFHKPFESMMNLLKYIVGLKDGNEYRYGKPNIPDPDEQKRKENGREKEKRTKASVQELERISNRYKKMKSQSAQNSSNEKTQNQSKPKGLTL
jgi:hypothetical protein